MKVVCALLLGAVAVPAVGQMAPSRTTAIVGAGKAGSWNTSIAVTNLDFYPLSIIITTTENNRAADCSLAPCNDYVNYDDTAAWNLHSSLDPAASESHLLK